MSTVAAGMESDSETDCDIIFSTNVKSDDKKSYQHTSSSIETLPPSKPCKNSCGTSDEMKRDKIEIVSPPVVRRMKKNNNANIAYNRQRALKNKTVVFDDLRYAILQGNFDITKNLYESNGIHADTILKSGWTGLMFACSVGHSEIVDYLLQRHANSNFHKDMFTSLMAACISKQNEENLLKCCILLLKYKANVNAHDRLYTTPLIFAAREGHTQIVSLLLEHGAEIDPVDSRGYTALAWAAYFGRGPVVRLLLEKGANRNKVNNMGQLPVDIAVDNGHNEVASLFQNIHTSENGDLMETQKILLTSNVDKETDDKRSISKSIRHSDNSKKYTKLGDRDVFLIGIGMQDLIEKFNEHQLTLQDLLIMDDADLEKIGIFQAGLRKRILEACKAVHKKQWENSSIPNLKKNHYISCPDAVAMVANISNHLKYISTSVVYIRKQVETQPRILELSKETANVHHLMDEVEESLKNLHTLTDAMKFLKKDLIKIKDKPEYTSSDKIETVSKEKSNKLIYFACAMAMPTILAVVLWKYNVQPLTFIRTHFLK